MKFSKVEEKEREKHQHGKIIQRERRKERQGKWKEQQDDFELPQKKKIACSIYQERVELTLKLR